MEQGMYKIEMHAHTSDTSPCAHVSAADMIHAMAEAGYDIVVVTDHFSRYVMSRFTGTPEEKVTRYLQGYREACRAGEKEGIRVFLGAEVNLHRVGKEDYLLYGITEQFLYDHPQMYDYTLKELFEACVKANVLVVQAHPCRSYCAPADANYLHGVELINTNPRHDNGNQKAEIWLKEQEAAGHQLITTCGSDYHQLEDIGGGGIRTARPLKDVVELAELLRSGEYELRKEGIALL
ncbi:MAG: PHP domain-containing protein [Lachnospiraceae bacterium]|nr:PHP domain-containing protein [Lachnospiraceae bacterium]